MRAPPRRGRVRLRRPRAEVWVKDNTRLTIDMSDAQFRESIRQTGLIKLAEYNIADTLVCEIDAGNAMPFALGDLCTYHSRALGLSIEQRVTEIHEVFEPHEISRRITIGREQITESQKILRAVTSWQAN